MIPRTSAASMEVLLAETAAWSILNKATHFVIELTSFINKSRLLATKCSGDSVTSLDLMRFSEEQLVEEQAAPLLDSCPEAERVESKPSSKHVAALYPPGKLLWMHQAGSKGCVEARVVPSRAAFTNILVQGTMLTNHFIGSYRACVCEWNKTARE